jgi:hypothetical protein
VESPFFHGVEPERPEEYASRRMAMAIRLKPDTTIGGHVLLRLPLDRLRRGP